MFNNITVDKKQIKSYFNFNIYNFKNYNFNKKSLFFKKKGSFTLFLINSKLIFHCGNRFLKKKINITNFGYSIYKFNLNKQFACLPFPKNLKKKKK